MKRFVLGLAVLLSLCGCSEAQAGFYQPQLTVQEQELWSGMAGPFSNLWEFTPPDGAKYLRYEVEYYKDGQLESAMEQRAHSFQLSAGKGRMLVQITPTANTQYGSSLGSVDFFDHPVLAEWTIGISGRRTGESIGFYTGYDFHSVYHQPETYHVMQYRMRDCVPLELDQQIPLLCLALHKDQSGDLLVEELGENLEGLRDFPYAYVLKVSFSAEKDT